MKSLQKKSLIKSVIKKIKASHDSCPGLCDVSKSTINKKEKINISYEIEIIGTSARAKKLIKSVIKKIKESKDSGPGLWCIIESSINDYKKIYISYDVAFEPELALTEK